MQTISELIRRRRAVFPKTYLPGKPIEKAMIEQLLENANWAPTHRLTEPWRFQVFHSEESRRELGIVLSQYYQKNTPSELFSEEKTMSSSREYKPCRDSRIRSKLRVVHARQDPDSHEN